MIVCPMFHGDVAACSCAGFDTAPLELAKCAAVFEARVDSVDPPPRASGCAGGRGHESKIARATVLRAWKGATPGARLDVRVGLDGGCEYRFQPGESYLVYARKSGDGLWTSICDRTRPSSEADEDFAALGLPL